MALRRDLATKSTSTPLAWLVARRRRVGRVLIAAFLGLFLANWARVIARPVGDFALHWRFGDRFVRGAFLYEGGMHKPYPPAWAMTSSALTVGPMPLVRATLYPLGLAPLAALLWMLQRMTAARLPLDPERAAWAAGLGVLLASRFVIRELPECGANLMIVALAWAGISLWWRGREAAGAMALGLSIALKCTPALFVAYLAWKRQWRMVGLTVAAALAFAVLPMARMGPESYAHHVGFWMRNAAKGLTAPSPIWGVLDDEKLQNVSLRPALGRLLVEAPPGHASHVSHPLRVPAVGLSPGVAGWVVKLASVALVVAVVIALGRDLDRSDGLRVAREAAAVSIVMLLLSPITWRQHCVAAVPAAYLIAREWLAVGPPARWRVRLLAAYVVLVLVLDRGVVGKGLTDVLDSYGATTWGLVALLAVTLGDAREAVGAPHRWGGSGAGSLLGRGLLGGDEEDAVAGRAGHRGGAPADGGRSVCTTTPRPLR